MGVDRDEDVAEMLQTLGYDSLDALIDETQRLLDVESPGSVVFISPCVRLVTDVSFLFEARLANLWTDCFRRGR